MSELDIRKLPPDAVELLNDPRVEGMTDPPRGMPKEERLLTPANLPAVGESPFLLMHERFDQPSGRVNWVNKPADGSHRQQGAGRGLAGFRDRPRFEESIKKPDQSTDLWSYLSWFVASPRAVEILSRFDRSVIDTVEIDWIFSDGQKLDGYAFLDVRRCIYAYDYRRTAVVVARDHGATYIDRLAYPRALHEITNPSVHVFRDAYHRSNVFMSRALAKELAAAGSAGIYFEDPAAIGAVRFESVGS